MPYDLGSLSHSFFGFTYIVIIIYDYYQKYVDLAITIQTGMHRSKTRFAIYSTISLIMRCFPRSSFNCRSSAESLLSLVAIDIVFNEPLLSSNKLNERK